MFTLSRDEVRELDRRAINDFGVPGVVLMENAGRGCTELLMRLNPEPQAGRDPVRTGQQRRRRIRHRATLG